MSAKLYGVGVGPGDPELITLKAVRVIKESDVIAIPVSNKDYATLIYDKFSSKGSHHDVKNSFTQDWRQELVNLELPLDQYRESCISYQIARSAISELDKKEILYLPMPMTKDKELLKFCHEYGISLIQETLDKHQSIAFLTLGDPTVYSTYLYIHKRALKQGYEAELISGVPSFCAVSAKLNMGLVENSEELHIIPASYQIEEALTLKGTKVLMKTGKNLSRVKEVISKQMGSVNGDSSSSNALSVKVVENCGMKKEKIYESIDEVGDSLSYYSMIVIKED